MQLSWNIELQKWFFHRSPWVSLRQIQDFHHCLMQSISFLLFLHFLLKTDGMTHRTLFCHMRLFSKFQRPRENTPNVFVAKLAAFAEIEKNESKHSNDLTLCAGKIVHASWNNSRLKRAQLYRKLKPVPQLTFTHPHTHNHTFALLHTSIHEHTHIPANTRTHSGTKACSKVYSSTLWLHPCTLASTRVKMQRNFFLRRRSFFCKCHSKTTLDWLVCWNAQYIFIHLNEHFFPCNLSCHISYCARVTRKV